MAQPDFFVVGAPKCGTTALHTFLGAHPEVFMPVWKEVHYFGSDLSGLKTQLSPSQHEALFAGAEKKKCVGETCIWALYSTKAAEEIGRSLPNARIVIMLREPVEMMCALHSEFVWHAVENVNSFRRAVALEEHRNRGRRLPSNGEPAKILFYRQIASFAAQVERYYRVFGREQVHVILYDDFRSDLPGVYRRLLEFLGVDPTFRPEFQVINPNKRVWSIRLRERLSNPSPLARMLVPFPSVRQWVYAALNAWNAGIAPRPPMNERLRQQLRDEMAPDVERLSELLQRDLSHWLDRQPA